MKLIIETEDPAEQKMLISASSYWNILFELKANFHRRWKYSDMSEEFAKGVYEVLDALKEQLTSFSDDDL